MAVSLAQFRAALGSNAKGISDADLQKRLDYMYRFSESFYDWWQQRKGGDTVAFGGGYLSDHDDDTERAVEKIKATEPNTYLVATFDREKVQEMRQIAKKQYEKGGNHK